MERKCYWITEMYYLASWLITHQMWSTDKHNLYLFLSALYLTIKTITIKV